MTYLATALAQEALATKLLQEQFLLAEGKDLQIELDDNNSKLARMRSMIHFMQEELAELLREIPRKPWLPVKDASELFTEGNIKRDLALEELADVWLFMQAYVCYAGISPEEFAEAIYAKRNKCYARLSNLGAK